MGYKHVFTMDPRRHDTIMANIQFLTHSMLLILGDILLSIGYSIEPDNFHELPSSIFILLGRMSKQQVHVYKGIATSNQYNALVLEELERIEMLNGGTDKDWLCDVIEKFRIIRDKIIENTKMSQREQDKICTPMSRVRDGIITYAQTHANTKRYKQINIEPFIQNYILSLSNKYDDYFLNIMSKVTKKLEILDFEKLTMLKYEGLR